MDKMYSIRLSVQGLDANIHTSYNLIKDKQTNYMKCMSFVCSSLLIIVSLHHNFVHRVLKLKQIQNKGLHFECELFSVEVGSSNTN